MSFISRLERFESVASTQLVVREWLDAGVPPVCVAVADEQTEGRGRQGRTWQAPAGSALLASAGFRPREMALRYAWRLAATTSLAMLDAAEEEAGLRTGTLWLKWPNDIVTLTADGNLRKVAGVLGETTEVDGRLASAVIGVGINTGRAAGDPPPELAASMTSLRELSDGRTIDRDRLLTAWLAHLEPRMAALEGGYLDTSAWSGRQVTTGRNVELDVGEAAAVTGQALGVDPESGALIVEFGGLTTRLTSGEVIRCRIITPADPSLRMRRCNG